MCSSDLNYGGNSSNVIQMSVYGVGSSAVNVTSGGVGIGITNPSSLLTLANGNIVLTGTWSTGSKYSVQGYNSDKRLEFSYDSGTVIYDNNAFLVRTGGYGGGSGNLGLYQNSSGNVGIANATPQLLLDVPSSGTFLGAGGASFSTQYGDVRLVHGNLGNGFTKPYLQTYQNGSASSVGVPGYSMMIQPFQYSSDVGIGTWSSRTAVSGLDTPHQSWFPNNQLGIVAKANWMTHRPANTVTGAQAPTVAGSTSYLNYNNPGGTGYSSSSIYSNFGSININLRSVGVTEIGRAHV